ncbi:mitochondrial glycoprotein [Xylaria bambusicola]|uniref:mitochondrial glycoprotein n=1 Tax=Xylaria bambusicola TaxID=326684 RepID=UPI00200790CE|nr:mitochondrial glycoprotein [Xylaria bambusicola]KAI0516915.1 mitochondrial glycoprotein [Xylaria bambusicola]
MMSFRAAVRSAPRSLSRMNSAAIRQTRIAQPSSLLRTTRAPLRTPQLAATFSSTPLRQAPANEADRELVSKLESEVKFENELKQNEQLPASIKDFLENSPYEVKDEPGKQDVYLVRKFGDETITVSFSIADLANYEQDMYNEDSALTDEELDTPEGKQLADTEAEDGLEDEPSQSVVPCRLNIVVEKPNKGALNIEAVAQDGAILVENFYYYKDPKMAHSSSAEADHGARDAYPGPPFGSLDEDLQLLLERYLEERGISQSMGLFVADYMDTKEQREYQSWLNSVKDFVAA